jgi:hypothetical protein
MLLESSAFRVATPFFYWTECFPRSTEVRKEEYKSAANHDIRDRIERMTCKLVKSESDCHGQNEKGNAFDGGKKRYLDKME